MKRDWPDTLDRAAARGDRLTAWRNKRQSALECGLDADALADTMDVEPGEWQLEFASILVTVGSTARLLKLDEIKERLVRMTLDREQESWSDE